MSLCCVELENPLPVHRCSVNIFFSYSGPSRILGSDQNIVFKNRC